MADLSKLRFNGTDYNVKDASAPLRKFTNYSKTGNLPITSDDTTQTAIGKLEKALDGKINTSAKGTASGVAELDANGKVPSSQLPSYVDDVLEYSAKSSFPSTGETGKIYVDTSTNKTYRWSGSAYVEISESLALGETSSTAYRGDRGKAAYDHSQASGNPHGTTGANTNLTGYSKGSSTDAVAATDTVNAAIAKHENRINANQTNILSAEGMVANPFNTTTAYAVGDVVTYDHGLYKFTSAHSAGAWNSSQVTQIKVSNNYVPNSSLVDVVNDGAKNLLNYDAWKTVGVNGGTAVWENNGVTLTATSSDCYTYYAPSGSFPDDAKISVNEGDKIVLSWEFERASSSITGSVFIFPNGNVSGSTNTSVTTKSLEYTVPSGVSFLTFRFGVNSGSGDVIKYKDIMICTKSQFEISPTYQPYALPNYDLTRLESEDRAALVEEIDAGAKNKFDFGEFTGANGATVTMGTDTVTVSGTQAWSKAYRKFKATTSGTYVLYYKITNNNSTHLAITVDSSTSGGTHYYSKTVFNPSTGVFYGEFTPPVNTDIYVVITSNNTSSTLSTAESVTVTDFMLCTKAAFGVSTAFVPYRPNYDFVLSKLLWIPLNVPQNGNDNYFGVVITGPNRGTYNINFMSNNGINGYGNIIVSTIYTGGAWNVYVDTNASANVTMKVYSISSTSIAIVFYAPNKWAGFTISGTDSNDQMTIYRSSNAPSWTEITQQAFPTT